MLEKVNKAWLFSVSHNRESRASNKITRWQARNKTKEGSVFFTQQSVELIATGYCGHQVCS